MKKSDFFNNLIPNIPVRPLVNLLIFCTVSGFSQNADTLTDYIDESNKIFKSNIKTVLLHRDGWDLSPPLLRFGNDEKLRLAFDDLDSDVKDYMFTIIHCDASWKPSDLEQYEYIEGYYDDYIYDYNFSVNTIQPYTHYELQFPTDDLKPKLSGNYILEVFVDNIDSVFFTRWFMIVDQKVDNISHVKQATNISDKNYKQELDVEINTSTYKVVNPYQDLKILITKNGRWDNSIKVLKPKMVVSDKLDYNYDKENVFSAGNEFRSFDIKSLKYNTEFIKSIDYNYEGYQVFLFDGQKRNFQVYKTVDDINGKMKIKTEDSHITEIHAEYVYVHIFLSYAAPLIDGDIYIIGALTDWRFSDESKMEYDFKRKGYKKLLLVKQGYYNYQFVLLYDSQTIGDETFIEGSHWETENDYTIYVYNREPGDNYDKLIGVKHVNSLPE
ncbi:MAG: DUF5103 domain-containing protein [Bacteroidales bacterium]|nr:DUF5103 domain-containing protein [Bacteroidales bacterium]